MSNSDLVQSVARSLQILEMVGRSEAGVTLQEMARRLEVQPSTAHNLARTLVNGRFLQKKIHPIRYELGLAFFELVEIQQKRVFRQELARVVKDVFERLPGATVTVTESVNGEILNVLRMSPELPGMLQQPQGRVMNPYTTAASLVFQAFWPEAERNAYRQRHPFDEFGAHLWKTLKRLDDFLEQSRRKGFVLFPTESRPFCMAAPIFSPRHDLMGALGVSMETVREKDDKDSWIKRVNAAVQSLSKAESRKMPKAEIKNPEIVVRLRSPP
ncbi:MAG: helix-turn-helix domain-containing protein [Verrucomicrobiae bacterium]|nr:helix-turn-helix domain-containing protein [Verrucomicrobiae bacterium]